MKFPIPKGWFRLVDDIVRAGDKILNEDKQWVPASDIGPSVVTSTGRMSAVGHPTALYVCVIRKTS